MPDDRSLDWYLLDGDVHEGPLSEPEMRARLRRSSSESLKVKQGESVWYQAEEVRRKIALLDEHGIYFRCAGIHEGPFTLTRAYRLLEGIDVAEIEIRTGARGRWVSAAKWLRKIEELRRRSELELRSLSDSLRRTLANLDSPNRVASDLLAVSEASIERIVIEDSGEIPVAALVPTVRKSAGPKATPKTPASLDRRPASALPSTSAEQFAGLKRTANKRKPSKRKPDKRKPNKGPRNLASLPVRLALIGAALAVVIGLGLSFLFKGHHEAETRGTGTALSTTLAGADQRNPQSSLTIAASPDQETPRPTSSTVEEAVPTGPPSLQDGMLFRPQFTTSRGTIEAGTAFAAKIEGSPGIFIISALHLFGPAGGLEADIVSEELPSVWQALTLEDCQSRNWFGEVEMRPVLLKDAKPMPNPSVFGDVAACVVADETGFNPLPLASRDPVIGEKVWMVSNVIGSASTRHPATIFGMEDGWLLYQFDQAYLELRATSGAPIVDQWGKVVAVNSGGGEHQGLPMGVGTPVTKFAQALRHQARN